MIVNALTILSGYGQGIVEDIKKNLASTGTDATGETSRSLRFEVKKDGDKTILSIYGRPYIMAVETGRGPKKSGGTGNSGMADNILKWMNVRGIMTDQDQKKRFGFAKFLTKRINEKGSKLYRDGGRKDIITPVINDTLINNITKDVLKEFSKVYLGNVAQIFKDGKPVKLDGSNST